MMRAPLGHTHLRTRLPARTLFGSPSCWGGPPRFCSVAATRPLDRGGRGHFRWLRYRPRMFSCFLGEVKSCTLQILKRSFLGRGIREDRHLLPSRQEAPCSWVDGGCRGGLARAGNPSDWSADSMQSVICEDAALRQ